VAASTTPPAGSGTLKPPPAAASPAATAAANITRDTKKAVDNGKDNSEEVTDKLPRDELFRCVSKSGLPTYRSIRGTESKLESLHDTQRM
jgi:hypothetical protein